MKKIFKGVVMLLMSMLFFVGCSEPSDAIEPDNNEDEQPAQIIEPFTIAVLGSKIDDIKAEITYDKEQESMPYFVGAISVAKFESSYKSDKALLLKYANDYIDSMELDINFSNLEVDNSYIFEGDATVDISKNWSLEYDTEYYIFAFGVRGDDEIELATVVETASFKSDEQTLGMSENEIASVAISDIESLNFKISVDAGDYTDLYALYILPADQVDDNIDDVAKELLLADFEKIGADDMSQANGDNLFSGDIEGLEANDIAPLSPDSQYVVVALGYGILNDKLYVVTQTVVSQSATTLSVDQSKIPSAEIKSVSAEDITISVSLNGTTSKYSIIAMSSSDYDTLMEQDGIDDDYDCVAAVMMDYYNSGTSINSYMGDADITINRDCSGYPIKANSSYKIFVFSCDKSKYLVLSLPFAIDVTTSDYSEDIERIGSIEVSQITHTNACISVRPGSYEGNYFILTMTKDEYENDYNCDDEEMMAAYIALFRESGFNLSVAGRDDSLVFTGDNDFNANIYWSLSSNVEHYSFVVGVGENFGEQVTPVLRSELFKTEPMPELIIDIDYVNVGTENAAIVYTPNYDDTPYLAALMKTSTFDNSTAEELADTYLMTGYMQYVIYEEQTSLLCSEYGLLPDEQYTAFAFGYDYYLEKVTGEMSTKIITVSDSSSVASSYAPSPMMLDWSSDYAQQRSSKAGNAQTPRTGNLQTLTNRLKSGKVLY